MPEAARSGFRHYMIFRSNRHYLSMIGDGRMKTRRWIIILSAAAIIGVLLSLWGLTREGNGDIAGIYSGGELLYSINVKDPANWHDYVVRYGDEWNTVTVDAAGVRVTYASCPDDLCVKQGFLRGGAPIVCLPNKLVIKWIRGGGGQYDVIA